MRWAKHVRGQPFIQSECGRYIVQFANGADACQYLAIHVTKPFSEVIGHVRGVLNGESEAALDAQKVARVEMIRACEKHASSRSDDDLASTAALPQNPVR